MNMERWKFCCIGFEVSTLILVISVHLFDDLFFLLCKERQKLMYSTLVAMRFLL